MHSFVRFTRVVIIAGLIVTAASALPVSVSAQGFTSEQTGLQETGAKAGFLTNLECMNNNASGGCIPVFIGTMVNALLGVFGAIFLALIMWGGVQYMLAQGDSQKVQAAKDTIKNAILGLVIVTASYAIANFVLDALASATSAPAAGGTTPTS